MTLKYLIQKEFIQIRRNAFLPRLILMFPIMIMCVMPWVMSQNVKNIQVVVVDNDRSMTSQQLVHAIEASNYFIFKGQKATYQEALKSIEHSQADVALVIPQDFAKSHVSSVSTPNSYLLNSTSILVATNAVNGTKGAMGANYLSQIVTSKMSTPALQQALMHGPSASGAEILYLYNKHLNYKRFMIPALLAIVMMLMTGFLPTLNIVGEKEKGTIEQMNVTPVRKMDFILAKLIPYWLIALLVVTICLILSWVIYGITPSGPLWLVYTLAMLLALFFSSFGLVISNYSDNMQQAIFVMWFFIVMMLLLSGIFTPSRSMPSWAYLTTYINPMSYFVDAIRTVFVRGGGLWAVLHQVLALVGIGMVMATWAVASYKKNTK